MWAANRKGTTEVSTGLHYAHSLTWGAAASAVITRSRSTAANHKASLALVMSGFVGMQGRPEMQSRSRILIANSTVLM